MVARHLIIVGLSVLLAACHHRQVVHHEVVMVPLTPIQAIRALPNFDEVQVEGRINVRLRTGYARSVVILHGDPRDLAQTQTRLVNNRLMVTIGEGFPQFGPVSAEIRTHYLTYFGYKGIGTITGDNLHSGSLVLGIDNHGTTRLGGSIYLRKLTLKGSGTVSLKGIHSRHLSMDISGNPHVTLGGRVNVDRIDIGGNSTLALQWINSDWLHVRARGHASIQVAGIVNKANVRLCDFARYHGRYLRARRSFTKTFDHSVTEINTIDRQHSLATGASDIYFFNLPEMKTDFMALDGSVLDMRDWSKASLQEYTVLNKQFQ